MFYVIVSLLMLNRIILLLLFASYSFADTSSTQFSVSFFVPAKSLITISSIPSINLPSSSGSVKIGTAHIISNIPVQLNIEKVNHFDISLQNCNLSTEVVDTYCDIIASWTNLIPDYYSIEPKISLTSP